MFKPGGTVYITAFRTNKRPNVGAVVGFTRAKVGDKVDLICRVNK